MSNIFFKTISFKKASYSYAYVDGKVLNIVLDGVDVPVEFKTHEEAVEGAKELNSILNGEVSQKQNVKSDLDVLLEKIKTGEVLEILDNCNEKLRNVVNNVRDQIQEKALEQAFKHVSKNAESRIDGMVKNLDDVLSHLFTKEYEQEVEEEPVKETKKEKRSFGSGDDVFGFTNDRTSADEPKEISEMLIGDMTTKQLRNEIDKFVTSCIKSERAQSMFKSISENFGPEATEQALTAFKELIYNVAISNPDKTLEEVLRDNFK